MQTPLSSVSTFPLFLWSEELSPTCYNTPYILCYTVVLQCTLHLVLYSCIAVYLTSCAIQLYCSVPYILSYMIIFLCTLRLCYMVMLHCSIHMLYDRITAYPTSCAVHITLYTTYHAVQSYHSHWPHVPNCCHVMAAVNVCTHQQLMSQQTHLVQCLACLMLHCSNFDA